MKVLAPARINDATIHEDHIEQLPDAVNRLLENVGYASSVPEFIGKEHVENVLHVLVEQAVNRQRSLQPA